MHHMDPDVKSAILTVVVWGLIILFVCWGLSYLGFSFHDLTN